MNENKLITIYGAKQSKDGAKLVITLVCGDEDEKQFYTACVKLDNSQKSKAKIGKDGYAVVKIPMLEDF